MKVVVTGCLDVGADVKLSPAISISYYLNFTLDLHQNIRVQYQLSY